MDYLEIGGENRPFRFGYAEIKKYSRKKGVKGLAETAESLAAVEIEDIPWITHLGLTAGAKKAGELFEFTISQVEEWIDDGGFELITRVFEEVASSISGKPKAATKEKPQKTEANP